MADGQAALTAPPEEVNVTTSPNAPVQQIPSAQSTALVQPTAADVLAGIQAAAAAAPAVSQVSSQPLTSAISPEAPLHHHMTGLLHALNVVGSIMGGSTTPRATIDPQGNVTVSHDPSTMGEKWGRVAAAALGGAAQGLANAQGPGGLARAAAAGTQYGLQLPQQRQQEVRQEATAEQQQLMRNAQLAQIHQQIARAQFDDRMTPIREARLEASQNRQFSSDIQDDGGTDYGTYSNEQEMRDMAAAHPELLNYHLSTGGQLIKVPNMDGTTRVYGIPANAASGRRLTEPRKYPGIVNIDADGKITTEDPQSAPIGTKTADYYNNFQAIIGKNLQAENIASQMKERTQAQQDRAQAAVERAADARQREQDTRLYRGAMLGIQRERLDFQTGGMGGGGAAQQAAAAGLHGEDFLDQLPADMRQQVQSIARGDTKMPTASRSAANQAIRNAVFNYDPTYTDARYQTKQNFKTGRDSDDLKRLSTALSHAENALQNSAAVGFSVSPTHLPTAASARYRTDADFLTDEIGTLVKGGALTQGQASQRIQDLHSSFPVVRKAAIDESLKLLGGRVGAILDKYRRGAGQQLPLDEFFGQDERDRILRHGVLPQTNQPAVPATQQPPASGQFTVTDPTGKVHAFNSQVEAERFKRLAGIQ